MLCLKPKWICCKHSKDVQPQVKTRGNAGISSRDITFMSNLRLCYTNTAKLVDAVMDLFLG